MREHIYFILVKPVYMGNIGSVARVMKNFGFQHLRFVEPPKGYKDSEARRMSVGAFEILKNAEVYDTLPQALADIGLAIGTTSGQQRDMLPAPFAEVAGVTASASATNKVAVVFGDERNGLSREELLRCHRVTTIPTDEAFPALNMAQAAAICAYELARVIGSPPATAATTLPTGEQDDLLFEQLAALLDTVEFSRTFNRKKVLTELRGFYQRTEPTTREHELLYGALVKINQRFRAENKE